MTFLRRLQFKIINQRTDAHRLIADSSSKEWMRQSRSMDVRFDGDMIVQGMIGNNMHKQKKKTTTTVVCQNLGLPFQTIFQDYKCILKVNFPFFGRLYIGEEHLMFVSNMFGIVKKAAILIDSITKLTELPNNSLSIIGHQVKGKKEDQEFIFSGFKNDHPYRIIYALWKKQTLSSEVLTSQNQDDSEPSEKANDNKLDQANVQINVFDPQIVETEKQKICQVGLSCSIEQFYNFFVADDAIYSRKKHLESKKGTNVVCTSWKRNQQMNADMRQINGTIKVKGVPFKSEATLNQVWMLTKRTQDQINIKVITQMADIPYSSNFTCQEHLTITKEAQSKCKFSCSTAVVFNKATYMKNTIMTRTFADIKEDYMQWTENVRQVLQKMRKSQDDNQKKKLRPTIELTFEEESSIGSPSKSKKASIKNIEANSGAIYDQRIDSLNRKVNAVLVLIVLLVLLLAGNIFLTYSMLPPSESINVNVTNFEQSEEI